ncbi:MAG: hypothetical protein NUV54_02310 [Candidatus Taylorbacteria bacterium]|nr:hypothetical protein [Candidatus Taylorbacteria bacterium]
MPRNIVQDVVPRSGNARRNSIRDISSSYTRQAGVTETILNEPRSAPSPRGGGSAGTNKSRRNLWIVSIVCALILVFILGNLFSSATVTVTQRSEQVSVRLDMTAKTNTQNGELSFTTLTLTDDAEERVVADVEKKVEAKASGKIVVYNDYTTGAQRLIKNTRFETPDGLIYRIPESITIPGRHTVSGQVVPGSVEVTVYADMPGEEYNIGLTDFTVPGFKSDSNRFASFYGRSKTPMTGGKIGIEKTTSNTVLSDVKDRLQSTLLKKVITDAREQVPDDSLFFDTSYAIRYEEMPTGSVGADNMLTIRQRAFVTVFLFRRDELASVIAKSAVKDYDGLPVTVGNVEKLSFTLISAPTPETASTGPVHFTLRGSTSVVWQFDERTFQDGLAGNSKDELVNVASKYPSILKADVVLRPFWKGSFPDNPQDISIVRSES